MGRVRLHRSSHEPSAVRSARRASCLGGTTMKLYSFLSVLAVCAGFAAPNAHAVSCSSTNPIASNPDSVYDTATVPGTAIDTRTKLMWQRCSVGQTWNGSTCTGSARGSAQGDGWAWVLQQSVNNKFAGFTDWRVPNVKELRSLVEECRGYPVPSINDTIFPNTPLDAFYSSSPS